MHDECKAWHDAGKKVVLVRAETSPEDIIGMVNSEAILTARGGMTSHAEGEIKGTTPQAGLFDQGCHTRARFKEHIKGFAPHPRSPRHVLHSRSSAQ